MSAQDFLVEIGTEELPPKALRTLSAAFTKGICDGLKEAGLAFENSISFASPRRLAVRIEALATTQADKQIEKRGPAKKAAFDADGQPTKALLGFCRSLGIEPDQLEDMETPKGTWLIYRSTEAGQATIGLLNGIVEQALAKLPIPKRMRWGAQRVEFVRPVQWSLMLFGDQVVPGAILDIPNGNTTRGHRFHSSGEITVNRPADYEHLLLEQGKVIADFEARKEKIRSGVTEIARTVGGEAVIDEALLDEVTALNEWPVPLLGNFEERFLAVPAEALISSMKEHQKYFHVVNAEGAMLPHFITLANIESKDPQQVISGNERVIRPRLSDAAFFFETDKKTTLEHKREALKNIVFQTKLGTIYDKTERVAQLAAKIAEAIGSDAARAKRAGELAKSDLVSEMVLEFTDLQGLMGTHYARHDGEHEEVALAIDEQYMPKYAGGPLPTTLTGCAVSLAEKIDSLVGLFGINQPPTGTKDPFALRRAALGVLRIIVEKQLPLDLNEVINWAQSAYGELENKALNEQLVDYMLERFRAWYEDEGVSAEVFLSVSARRPTRPLDFHQRVQAVNAFYQRSEAEALSAANKRVSNILAKQGISDASEDVDSHLLSEDAEKALASTLAELHGRVTPLFDQGDYQTALTELASLQAPVDAFFDQVMVMADDENVRNNRIALLTRLRNLFLRVADISLLSK
ncbi:MAG: glycine--tRNA ligase subunit beta [Oleiphilaceae bacterium]|nr:glycine--tRNA ligase subunit beta [Oleiphilaceae bacterium]